MNRFILSRHWFEYNTEVDLIWLVFLLWYISTKYFTCTLKKWGNKNFSHNHSNKQKVQNNSLQLIPLAFRGGAQLLHLFMLIQKPDVEHNSLDSHALNGIFAIAPCSRFHLFLQIFSGHATKTVGQRRVQVLSICTGDYIDLCVCWRASGASSLSGTLHVLSH